MVTCHADRPALQLLFKCESIFECARLRRRPFNRNMCMSLVPGIDLIVGAANAVEISTEKVEEPYYLSPALTDGLLAKH